MVPFAPPLARLFERLGERLLDVAVGHRAAWPTGDPLSDCPELAREPGGRLAWLHVHAPRDRAEGIRRSA
ncbi:hypothetical protein GCM10023321_52770 [Pseudonocardia eucalypti]|uniref:Uncharacterized protein n=1 Tax=Pseudonocardia eucalypti TaxID=648755 RepID=A0ABP9QML1_9PSEU|nr:hypothetical protein [Pseudonocardia eucalypti]